jgi:quinol-cytochrome oxidoreductase complex cytochrome b subunit
MGTKIRFLMLGGHTVNANALLRFYVLHCVVLPLAAALLWRSISGGFAKTAASTSSKLNPMPR